MKWSKPTIQSYSGKIVVKLIKLSDYTLPLKEVSAKVLTADAIEAELRTIFGMPLLFRDDPRTRIKLGG